MKGRLTTEHELQPLFADALPNSARTDLESPGPSECMSVFSGRLQHLRMTLTHQILL